MDKLVVTQKNLDEISPSFCLAKWLHISLHLDRGSGHSCHHPLEQKIPSQDLLTNPSALHNTYQKKLEREEMMRGGRPSACEFCWRIEKDSNAISDRILKSSMHWALPEIEKVKRQPTRDINPTYVEVGFSNLCQLKCSYCGPHNSSSWAKEIEREGNYTLRNFPSVDHSENGKIYKRAFWNWWPELSKNLKVLRITGGEPLLIPETWTMLDKLLKDPLPELELVINTNLSVDLETIERLTSKIYSLRETKSVRRVVIATSMEALNTAAEYIRNGINNDYFWANLKYILKELPEIEILVISTIQIMSVKSFLKFFEEILRIRKSFAVSSLVVEAIPIKNPEFMCIENLPHDLKYLFSQDLQEFIKVNSSELTDFEVIKIEALISLLDSPVEEEAILETRLRFYEYFRAYDVVRKLSFQVTFPELETYWLKSAELYEKRK